VIIGQSSFVPLPRQGSEYVRWVQSMLNRVLGLQLPINGIMGVETRSAVRSFQEQQGLPADGIVGPDTEEALRAAARGQVAPPDDTSPPESQEFALTDDEYADLELEVEGEVDRSSRDYIRWIQRSLNHVMGLQLVVDGIIGPMTRSAIRDFQRRAGLGVDGIVGPLTEQALLRAGVSDPPGTSPTPVLPPTSPVQPPTSTIALRNNIVSMALQERARWGNGTITECESRIRSVLEGYWRTGVGWVPSSANWCSGAAWSAAFISWVMRKAGAGSAFKYSSAHTDYVGAAKLNRLASNNNPFHAYRITEMAPRVGDLVCVERQDINGNWSGVTYDNVDKGFRASHCDIVTAVQPGKLTIVGGNVSNTVGQKTISIDSRGLITAPRYYAVVRVGA
jgi:peptidoglycan hydrolase-like protein with peptidoglycan-binding domain